MPSSSAYLRPDVLARIAKLGLRAGRVVEGTVSGMHRSPLHGVSVEFADYREYAPGDDLKRLDWRVFGRTNRFFIKRFEEESNLRCTILVDASGSMRYPAAAGVSSSPNLKPEAQGPGTTKFDVAATAAACLAAMLMRQRDAVGLVTFDTAVRATLRPAATQRQLAKILDTLGQAKVGGETQLGQVLSDAADRIHKRGLVILISDLLGELEGLYKALGKLQSAGHEIILLQVLHPDEVELPFDDSVIFRDLEGNEELFAEPWAFRKAYRREIQKFLDDVRKHCRFCGIDHLLLRTDEDLGASLSHYLHERLRRPPVKHRGSMASLAGGGPA